MLDVRIYRAALVPVLFALLVVAFALESRPQALGTTLAPDAFNAEGAFARLDDLAEAYPMRRPGSRGDEALADRVERDLRAALLPGRQVADEPLVRRQRVKARTIDGRRTLINVIATRPGAPGPGLVVLAHRDAAGRGARAELSATAGLIELARVAGDGRLRRTITFVSTSGGSGGSAGAKAVVDQLPAPVDAVLVLGDLASEEIQKPFVTGWSDDGTQAPLLLRRTLDSAVRAEALTDPGGPRASTQWIRQALPAALGEQAVLGAAGLPAVLLSAAGERGPAAGAPVSEARLQRFGRAALRTITALDAAPGTVGKPRALLVTQRKVLPAWAVRLLVAALLLPVLVATVDGFARARRRRAPLRPAAVRVLGAGAPFVLVALLAFLLRVTGLIDPAPPALAPAGTIPFDSTAKAALIVLLLAFALAWLLLRPFVLRTLGAGGPDRTEEAAAGASTTVALLISGLAAVTWVLNPFAAGLLVPAAHGWLLATAPDTRIPRPFALLLVLAGTLPFLVVAVVYTGAFGFGPGEAAWSGMLLLAGGQVGVLGVLAASLFAATGLVALGLAARPPATSTTAPASGSIRGPAGYAGPGSLGGTSSARRR